MIRYESGTTGLGADDLAGFFEGWPDPPAPRRRLAALRGADHVVLAFEGDRLVGFVTAITDGALIAFVPLLEVLPEFRGRGIGTELMGRVLAEFEDLYGIDLNCDPDLVPFYERMGMTPATAMIRRRPSGPPPDRR